MKIVKTLVLTLALAGVTYAGDIPQPAPSPQSSTQQTTPGDIPQPLTATPASQPTTKDIVTATLRFMVSLLSLR